MSPTNHRDSAQLQGSGQSGAAFEGRAYPLFVDPQARPCFRIERGRSAHRVLLTSIPKSGTYLFGELFRKLGFVDAGIHIEGRGGNSFTDYRFTSLSDARQNPHLEPISLPLARTLGLILPGQYVVSHLQVTDDLPTSVLAGFKVAFACRNLRACLVSLMLFLVRTASDSEAVAPLLKIESDERRTLFMLRHYGQQFLDEASLMMNVLARTDVLRLKFEDAVNLRDGPARTGLMKRIVEFLDLDVDDTRLIGILNETLGANTMTRSAQPTSIERYWSTKAEREFARMGGCDLNRRLGYQ